MCEFIYISFLNISNLRSLSKLENDFMSQNQFILGWKHCLK